jgi:CheY-like chemotaxis protein
MKDSTTGDQKQLLLIDDDPNLILLVKDYLEFRGYAVNTAGNGREALEVLDSTEPDMIICDVMMPEMDGYTFVKQVRENPDTEWIPILFLSAKGQSQDRVKGLNTGADVYMVAGVAQLVELLICNQPVAGSSPVTSFQVKRANLFSVQGFRPFFFGPAWSKVVWAFWEELGQIEIRIEIKIEIKKLD